MFLLASHLCFLKLTLTFADVFSKTEDLLGPVDILINNAAYFVDPDYEKVVETNLVRQIIININNNKYNNITFNFKTKCGI